MLMSWLWKSYSKE